MESISSGTDATLPRITTVQPNPVESLPSCIKVEFPHCQIHTADQTHKSKSSQQITSRNISQHPVTDPTKRQVLSIADLYAIETPVKTCLLQSYSPTSFSAEQQGIARPFHGVQHACRVSTWAIALLQLRKEMADPAALSFPDEMIPLLIQACLYHDSGRDGDDEDQPEWEQASGNNLAEHLRNSGYSQQIAWQCAEAIRLKDQPELCEQLPESVQTIRSLLHDADTLDVMRVRGTFYMDRLDCFKNCSSEVERENVRKLAIEVCQTIAEQGDLYSGIALQDHEESTEHFHHTLGHYCEKTRMNWEHHPHPLCNQLINISRRSERLNKLLVPCVAGLEEEQSTFSQPTVLLSKLQPVKKQSGDCRTEGTAQYHDPDSGHCWYVKHVSCHEDACNQVLMAKLARELGLTVPETFAHEENGEQFVICRSLSDLERDRQAISELPREQWAKLLLINAIIGNSDWKCLDMDAEGNPVMYDWGWAGLATRYQKNSGKEPGEDDFSSMPVLLKKLRDPDAPDMNSHPINVACQPILASLSDDELTTALQAILQTLDPNRLNQLVEQSGFRAGDRTWLRQTLWDRIAWLSSRFPDSRGGDAVSEAEYRAIQAAGTRGGWLQVNNTDVPSGQICVEELLDSDGAPQTRMTARLSGDATRRLSDQLAIERGLHHLRIQIEYFNTTSKQNYSEWRSDLTEITRQSRDLAKALSNERERWVENHRPTVDQIAQQLTTVANQADATLQAEQPGDVECFPELPDTLPPPAFPGRVTSRLPTELNSIVQLAEYSHGFTKLTGKRVSHFDGNPEESKAQPIPSFELQAEENEQGTITFYAENLPKAQSFEHKLVITHPDHSRQTVEALFRELHGLGVRADRANKADLENHWLDQLANYHKCREAMLKAVDDEVTDESTNDKKRRFLANRLNMQPEQLDWESHVRIRSGRLVHYRPGLPHNISQNPAAHFSPSHNLSFDTKQRGQGKMVALMLENEASLSSFERRSDLGLEPLGPDKGLVRQIEYNGGGAVFTRIKPNSDTAGRDVTGLLSMQLKSSALGRLDTNSFRTEVSYTYNYSALDAHRRNNRQQLEKTEEFQSISSCSEQETLYAHSLSLFDELDTLKIGNAYEQRELLRTLKKRYSHWPDGRPVEAIFQHSIRSWYFELVNRHSSTPHHVKNFLHACGLNDFEHLMNNNPNILQGKLDNLDGVHISFNRAISELSDLDFRECSMVDTHLDRLHFENCQFTAEKLDQAKLNQVEFYKCTFEGDRFSRTTLENATFCGRPYDNKPLSPDEIKHLALMLHRSCHTGDACHFGGNEFDLEFWVDLLTKNSHLCHHSLPLDRTVCGLIRKYSDRIQNIEPEKLAKLVERVIPIIFYGRTEDLKTFVTNNPLWFERKINKLDGLLCTKYSFDRTPNHPGMLLKWVDSDVVMEWLTRFSDLMISTDPSTKQWQDVFGEIAKLSYLSSYHPELLQAYSGTIEASARKQLEWGHLPGPAMFQALQYLAQDKTLSVKDEAFWLSALTRTVTEHSSVKYFDVLVLYRRSYNAFWHECRSAEAKSTAAKLLISSGNIFVNPETTVDAFELLIEEGLGEKLMEHFVKNLHKHENFSMRNYGSDGLKNRLQQFEQRLKNEHPELFQLWREFEFVPKS